MLNIVCPHCQTSVVVPDDLAQAHCVRCGKPIGLAQTNITASPVFGTSPALQSHEDAEYIPSQSSTKSAEAPTSYSSWEDFRSNSPVVQRAMLEFATRLLPDMRSARMKSLPPNIPDEAGELGAPLATVIDRGENPWMHPLMCLVAALVLQGVTLVFTLPLLVNMNRTPSHYAMAVVAHFLAACAGVGVYFFRKPGLTLTYWILENGIVWERGSKTDACRWEDLHALFVSHEEGYLTLWLKLRPDLYKPLSSSSSPATMPVLEYMITKTTACQFLPLLRRVVAGESVWFGVVWLDRTGLATPHFFSPWSELVKVVSDPTQLFVEVRNRQTWHQIRFEDVAFPYAVQAICHVMIEEHTRLPPIGA